MTRCRAVPGYAPEGTSLVGLGPGRLDMTRWPGIVLTLLRRFLLLSATDTRTYH
jgi:hypothetical protein